MFDSEPASPGLFTSLRKLLDTSLGVLQNRAELLAVEFQEEKDRAAELFIWAVAVLFFAIMSVLVVTATIIFLFPESSRVYAAGGLAVIYLAGAVWAALGLKARLKQPAIPFASTVAEIKKDREWLLK